MKSNYLFLIIIFAILGSLSSIYSQNSAESFDRISLDHPLPEIFRAGEIYILKGTVANFQKNMRITADLHLVEGATDYQKLDTQISRDGRFALNLYFKYPGLYNFSLKINYKLAGSRLLKAIKPIQIDTKQPAPISEFGSAILDFQPRLLWQTENELVQLVVIQDAVERVVTISNRPAEYRFDPSELKKLHAGEAQFRIRGARSTDGSWYTQSSPWGKWLEIRSNLTEYIAPEISSRVQFKQPYQCQGRVGSNIHFEVFIKTTYNPKAYIKRPDGGVDILHLKSDKRLSDFNIGGETKKLLPAGRCWLDYYPRVVGSYRIEINDPYGNALVNMPYYYGDLLPILPPEQFEISGQTKKFDRDARR